MKRWGLVVCAMAMGWGFVPILHAAVDDEALADLLMRKGVLSPKEVRSLQQDAATQQAVLPQQSPVPVSSNLPSWVTAMQWSGDVRVRYESLARDTEPLATPDRNRFRIRARYGFKAKVNEQMEAGIRIATGSGTPTSTNETMEDAFEKQDLKLDRAYILWTPTEWGSLMLGKFSNPFFSTDLVFDEDLSFDGFSEVFTHQDDYADYYLIFGQFPIDELDGDNNSPWMYAAQVGVVFDPFQDVEVELAVADYAYTNLFNYPSLGTTFGDNSQFGGSLNNEFRYANSYNCVNITGKMDFYWRNLPLRVVGDYVTNTAADDPASKDDDTGYQVGLHVGKAKDPKTMEAFFYYKYLEANAVVDVFTDSDFGGGGTNHKGFRTGLKYQLLKNTQLGLTYIDASLLKDELGLTDEDAKTVQVDMSVKF